MWMYGPEEHHAAGRYAEYQQLRVQRMHGLMEVKLPEGLTSIYSYAFQNCDSLERVDFPASVTTPVGAGVLQLRQAFRDRVPGRLESVPDWRYNSTSSGDGDSDYRSPFEGCAALKKIEVPEGVESVPKYAFRYQTSLEEVVLPESLTGIGAYAFEGCSGLPEVNLPEAVASIGSYGFCGCTGLKSITLPAVCRVSAVTRSADARG